MEEREKRAPKRACLLEMLSSWIEKKKRKKLKKMESALRKAGKNGSRLEN